MACRAGGSSGLGVRMKCLSHETLHLRIGEILHYHCALHLQFHHCHLSSEGLLCIPSFSGRVSSLSLSLLSYHHLSSFLLDDILQVCELSIACGLSTNGKFSL